MPTNHTVEHSKKHIVITEEEKDLIKNSLSNYAEGSAVSISMIDASNTLFLIAGVPHDDKICAIYLTGVLTGASICRADNKYKINGFNVGKVAYNHESEGSGANVEICSVFTPVERDLPNDSMIVPVYRSHNSKIIEEILSRYNIE